ncbi:podocalyxin isoform X2 [Alligator mississippiensis]|uniref:podocalyxin isoform X2 n=1 Tax=Alligator mississippiensis TaxID=8496 RepID=UPI0028781416|nr:podocalyxin isoform X2 [Alligator mississippiensis]
MRRAGLALLLLLLLARLGCGGGASTSATVTTTGASPGTKSTSATTKTSSSTAAPTSSHPVLGSSSNATKTSLGSESSTPSPKSVTPAPKISTSSSKISTSDPKSTSPSTHSPSPTSVLTTHVTKKSSPGTDSSTNDTTVPSTTQKSPSLDLGSTSPGAGSSSPTMGGPPHSTKRSSPDPKTTPVSIESAPRNTTSSSRVTEIPSPSPGSSSGGKVTPSPVVNVAPTSAPRASKPTVPGVTSAAGAHPDKDPVTHPTLMETTAAGGIKDGSKELKEAETTRGTSAATVGTPGGDKKDVTTKKSDPPLLKTDSALEAATSTPASTKRVSEPSSTSKPSDSQPKQQITCKEQIPSVKTGKEAPKLVTLNATGICGVVAQTKQSEELYDIICKALNPTFNRSRDQCTVSLAPVQGSPNLYALVDASMQIKPRQEELFELLKEKKDEFKKAGINNVMLADKQLGDDEPTDRFSTPLITTIVCLAVALLLTAAIYGCCHQRRSRRKDQTISSAVPGFEGRHVAVLFTRLTEELQTMENGYHDNPTLEVMETSSEMQEKKINLNGELGDSWIVPMDNLTKEELEEEEDTHL